MALVDHWPLFGLRLRTPNLELRYPDDDEIASLIDVAGRGVHDPERMPFFVPWTDLEPPEFEREALKYWWRCRSEVSPARWTIPFAVFVDGEPAGVQELAATDFPTVRSAATGSWLGLDFQGKGIGTEMRQAVVAVAFDHLGAREITSSAFVDNVASQRVSERVGYVENGTVTAKQRDRAVEQVQFRLTAERWAAVAPDWRPEVTGVERCLGQLGVAPR